jgi:hypothetical protein
MKKIKTASIFLLIILVSSGSSTEPYCPICELIERGGSYGDPVGVAPPLKNVTIFNGVQYLDYPIDSLVYTKTGEKNTTVRMKVTNIYENTTKAFRISLQSKASWFKPKEMYYTLDPDGFTSNGWPYWEVYPLEPNESIELSFVVDAVIGTANLIDAKAQTITRWDKNCSYPIIERNDSSEFLIENYLRLINETDEATLYFSINESNQIFVLALVDSEFGVFRLNDTNVSGVSDYETIAAIVDDYLDANKPNKKFNTSKPYELMNYSKNVSLGPESSCAIITGMDRYNCTDRQSCFYSCFSVPVCSYIATGWEFIDTILDYKKSIDFANLKFNKSLNSSYEFKTNSSYESAQAALTDMKELNKAETIVVFHPIFTNYNYCPPADYAIPQQMEARRVIMDYLGENCLYGEREKIINQSMELGSRLGALENITVEENVSINITKPVPNITINETNISEIPVNESEDVEECAISKSPYFGICWEYWIIVLLVLVLLFWITLNKRKKKK